MHTKVAEGVTFSKGGKNVIVSAKKEVILSAGAIQSSQLLMLLGIAQSTCYFDILNWSKLLLFISSWLKWFLIEILWNL